MDRRRFLAVAGVALSPTVAGCSGGDDPGPASPTDEGSADAGNGDTPTTADHETEASIDVGLRTVGYVVNTYEVPVGSGIDPDSIVPERDVPEILRDALYEARDEGFETDSVSEALLAAVDEFRRYENGHLEPYVELGGVRYEFDPMLPTFVAELDDETLADYEEGRLLGADERRDLDAEPVRAFVNTLTVRGAERPRTEYRRSVLPDAVAEFLEEYDYLEDAIGVSRIETAVRNSDPPHTVELRELTAEDVWGRPVVDETELDAELVSFFERALTSDHRNPALPSPDRSQYFVDEVPATYFDVAGAEDPPYFRLDGTVYSISVGEPVYHGVPVSVSVSVEELAEARRVFELTVSPAPEKGDTDVEGPVRLSGRGALPSVLWITHDGDRYLLESPDYDTDRWRDAPDDPTRDRRPNNLVRKRVRANEEIGATYTVPDELPEGTYVSRGSFGISWRVPQQVSIEGATYPFELLITIDSS